MATKSFSVIASIAMAVTLMVAMLGILGIPITSLYPGIIV